MDKLEIDTTEFNRTLSKYMKVSKRTLPQIVHQKAYWVTVGAIQYTKQADKKHIRAWISNWKESAPTIIKTYKLRKHFNPKEYIAKFKKYRIRSVGYLQAGFIMALKLFGTITGNKTTVKGAGKQKGRLKGAAIAAKRDSINPQATIINKTGHKASQANALRKYGWPALQISFRKETASMKRYIEKKMREAGRKVGVRS